MTKYFRLNTTAANIRTGAGTNYPDKGDLIQGDVVQVDEAPAGGWSPYKIAQHSNGNWVTLDNGSPLDGVHGTFWSQNAYFVEVASLPRPLPPPDPDPDPVPTLTHTIEVYSDGSIKINGQPYP